MYAVTPDHTLSLVYEDFYFAIPGWLIKVDKLVRSPISVLRTAAYYKYASFFGICDALILNFLLCHPKLAFYECIKSER